MKELSTFGQIFRNKYSIKSVLGRQVQAGLAVEAANDFIKSEWGQKALDLAKGISLKRGTITIAAANAIMSQEIKFKQKEIMDFINKKIGQSAVKKLVIIIKGIDNSRG